MYICKNMHYFQKGDWSNEDESDAFDEDGSEEESGKDWDELEEEARNGN